MNLIENDLSGEFYSMFLLDEKDSLPDLSTSTLSLSEVEQENMLRHLLQTESHNIFNPDIIRFFGLSSRPIKNIINNEKEDLPENIIDKLTVLRSPMGNENISDLRYVIFNTEWYETPITSALVKLSALSENHPEEYAAHMVAHLVATRNYASIPTYGEDYESDENYIKYLSYYLRYMRDFSVVLDSLKEPQSSVYVKSALRLLFRENHLKLINTTAYLTTYYSVIKAELEDVDLMYPIVVREPGTVNNINEKNIADISNEFLEDLFSVKHLNKIKEKLHLISQDIFSIKEQLYIAFKAIESNRSIVLQRMASAGKYVHMTTGINLFANWYRTLESAQLKSSNHVRLIWSFLVEEQRSEILKELHDVLMEVDTLKERRIKVIHDFHDVIGFTEPGDKTSRRAIAALFGESSGDEILRAWLNAQQFTFSAWPKTEAETVSQVINDNQHDFSDVISRSSFIKNRLPAPAEEPDEN